MLQEGKLHPAVDAPCGTINHDAGQGTGRMNVDGSPCGRDASRFVRARADGIEVLTCGHHVDEARERIGQTA